MTTEKEKMLAGLPYDAADAELQADHAAAEEWMARYNAPGALPASTRHEQLSRRLAHVGRGAVVRPPFHIDYGYNITLGDGVFLNFGCILLDVTEISIGDGTQIGPGVQLLAADHPRDPVLRRSGLEFGRPVRIGANAWIGGGAIVVPGVTIGDDVIVGAGAVVTRDVPAGTTVAGVPARAR